MQCVHPVNGDPTASTHVTATMVPTAVLMTVNANAPQDGLASTAHSVSHRHTLTYTHKETQMAKMLVITLTS